ncbi:MAG: sugar phosphate isomerase/epimerase [Sedimentisphaerales bacterium]|nr:sugar phosphate isomerase/epimerase [Sedimentisphaerales bacterium]
MKSSVTISLVEAIKGCWVFKEDLSISIPMAKEIGFDAVELFPGSADDIDSELLRRLLAENQIELSAIATGAGEVLYGFTLASEDLTVRVNAVNFIERIIDVASSLGVPVIIGSMQGYIGKDNRRQKLAEFVSILGKLAQYAADRNVGILFEPLNRRQAGIANTLADGVEIIKATGASNIKLLADFFHMGIEEENIARSIKNAAEYIGYVHFVDSYRKPAGTGHIDIKSAVEALKEIGYDGFLSAEALPFPDSRAAAQQTIKMFRLLCK